MVTVHNLTANIIHISSLCEPLLNRQGGRVEAAAAQLLLWPPSSNRTGGFSAFGEQNGDGGNKTGTELVLTGVWSCAKGMAWPEKRVIVPADMYIMF